MERLVSVTRLKTRSVIKAWGGPHANSADYATIVQHMSMVCEIKSILDTLAVNYKTIAEDNVELSQSVIEMTLQLKRLTCRESALNDATLAALTNIKNESCYMTHATAIVTEATSLCEEIGKKHVQRENNRYKEIVHKLNLHHLGGKDGGEWTEGMPQAKPGKLRTWATYYGHASETIMKNEAASELESYIANAQKATCKIYGTLAFPMVWFALFNFPSITSRSLDCSVDLLCAPLGAFALDEFVFQKTYDMFYGLMSAELEQS